MAEKRQYQDNNHILGTFQITERIKDPKCAINSGRSPTGKKKELKDTSFCKMTIFYNSDNFLQEYSNSLEL